MKVILLNNTITVFIKIGYSIIFMYIYIYYNYSRAKKSDNNNVVNIIIYYKTESH